MSPRIGELFMAMTAVCCCLFSPAGRSAERMRGDEGVAAGQALRPPHPALRATFSPLGRRGSATFAIRQDNIRPQCPCPERDYDGGRHHCQISLLPACGEKDAKHTGGRGANWFRYQQRQQHQNSPFRPPPALRRLALLPCCGAKSVICPRTSRREHQSPSCDHL